MILLLAVDVARAASLGPAGPGRGALQGPDSGARLAGGRWEGRGEVRWMRLSGVLGALGTVGLGWRCEGREAVGYSGEGIGPMRCGIGRCRGLVLLLIRS